MTEIKKIFSKGMYSDMVAIAQEEAAQEAKADSGKLELDLVPMQLLKDCAEVRMYGNKKYGASDNWKQVEMRRYVNALLRHMTAFVEDYHSVDEESGIPHYKHMICNLAFIADMMARGDY